MMTLSSTGTSRLILVMAALATLLALQLTANVKNIARSAQATDPVSASSSLSLVNYIKQTEDLTNKVIWEWTYYSKLYVNNNATKKKQQQQETKTSLLKGVVAQYANHDGPYAELMATTRRANEAYAHQMGLDYLVVHGAILKEGIVLTPGVTAFNKPYMIQEIMRHDKTYDFCFLIDSDAMVTDFTIDARTLVEPDRVMIAHRGNPKLPDSTPMINNGVTLWNLQNDRTSSMLNQWNEKIVEVLEHHNATMNIDDQGPLHTVLGENMRSNPEHPLSKGLLNTLNKDFVLHQMRGVDKDHGNKPSWFQPQTSTRLHLLKQHADRICSQYGCDLPKEVEAATFLMPSISSAAGLCH